MTTHYIPVMFDVTTDMDREAAAKALCDLLVLNGLVENNGMWDGGRIESWWFIEGQDKHADGNDNDAGTITFIPYEQDLIEQED